MQSAIPGGNRRQAPLPEPWLHPHEFADETQWAVLPIFLALFLSGVTLWLLMLKRHGLFAGNSKALPADAATTEPDVTLIRYAFPPEAMRGATMAPRTV